MQNIADFREEVKIPQGQPPQIDPQQPCSLKPLSEHRTPSKRAQAIARRARIKAIEERLELFEQLRLELLSLIAFYGAEVDDLTEQRHEEWLQLEKLDRQLVHSGDYNLSDEQQDELLRQIAEDGADVERFCHHLGVDSVAEIPYHRRREALAALAERRAKVEALAARRAAALAAQPVAGRA
jgi:hypothetical protein